MSTYDANGTSSQTSNRRTNRTTNRTTGRATDRTGQQTDFLGPGRWPGDTRSPEEIDRFIHNQVLFTVVFSIGLTVLITYLVQKYYIGSTNGADTTGPGGETQSSQYPQPAGQDDNSQNFTVFE